MNDLISRQAAIDAINRLDIPEDMCVFEILSHIELELGTLPSAQPEIIRCKDCKHREAENGFCEGRGWPMQLVPDDGFCDKGAKNDLQSMGMSRSGI